MSTRELPESGLFTGRVEWVAESTTGQYLSGPSYEYYADDVASVTNSPGLDISRRDGLGTPDPVGHENISEEPTITVTYWLQRELVDGSGNTTDASGDAWDRNSDGRIKNTHQVRIREDRSASDPDDPGNASGARIYTIGSGCHPNATFTEDTDRGLIEVELTYECEKVRQYEIYQPNGSEALDISSSDSNDTSQSLTIEDDSDNDESVSLNGTTTETTTKSDWSSIRSLELDSETQGDVTVSLSSSGDTLATIRGSSYYHPADGTLEGDLGVPSVTANGGGLASSIGNAYDSFAGATIQRGGSDFNYDVAETVLTVENNYNREQRNSTVRTRVNEGNRNATAEFDLIGWGASPQFYDEALGGTEDNVDINTAKTNFTFNNAVITEPADTERNADDTEFIYDVTVMDSADGGVTVSQA